MREKEKKSYEKYIGQKFGKLLIKSILPQQKKGIGILVECHCDCGNISTPRASAVIHSKTKTCGCSWRAGKGSPRILEKHIGEIFGKLTVIDIIQHVSCRVCLCKCECGNFTKTRYNNLLNGNSSSCGCIKIPTLEKRQHMFLRFVEKKEICWIWRGNISTLDNRYGTYHGKRAHRVSYQLFKGEIPKGKMVLHKCDVPLCVSPDCLFLGDAKMNSKDMVLKDRHSCGERSGMAKLTKENIVDIRKKMQNGEYGTTLAKIYNVSPSTIYNIRAHKRWKHIEE